ncbi:PilZ domain-containing protein [Hydrogenobaculum acidophilum]
MVKVFEIDIKEVASKLQKGKEYSIYTIYRDVPINIKVPLSWVDTSKSNEVYLAFNWKNTSMKYAFQTGNPVYVKFSIPYQGKELSFYIKCDVFSSIRDELVLMANAVLEVPPFLKRTSVRVEIDSKHKSYASLCPENIEDTKECLSDLELKNISEGGFAIKIKKDEEKSKIVLNILKDLAQKNIVFEAELYIDSHQIRAKANIVNIYEEDEYIIAGFKMSVDKKDIQKLSSIIMKLQQEIIQEIKSL